MINQAPLPTDLESAIEEIKYLRRALVQERYRVANFVGQREQDRRARAGSILARKAEKEKIDQQILESRKLTWALLEDLGPGSRSPEAVEFTGTVAEALRRAARVLFEE